MYYSTSLALEPFTSDRALLRRTHPVVYQVLLLPYRRKTADFLILTLFCRDCQRCLLLLLVILLPVRGA